MTALSVAATCPGGDTGAELQGHLHPWHRTPWDCLLSLFQEESGAGGLPRTVLGNVLLPNKHVGFLNAVALPVPSVGSHSMEEIRADLQECHCHNYTFTVVTDHTEHMGSFGKKWEFLIFTQATAETTELKGKG